MYPTLKKILFYFLIGISLNACAEKKGAEPVTYLLPSSYTGAFAIVFDVQNGTKIEYEGKSRIYRIPSSGILLTRFSFNEGWLRSTDIKFFFLDKTGKRITIKNRIFRKIPDTPENRKDKEIYIFSGSTGTQELGQGSPSERCTISTIRFAVGTKRQILDGIKEIDLFKVFARPPFPCQKNYKAPSD